MRECYKVPPPYLPNYQHCDPCSWLYFTNNFPFYTTLFSTPVFVILCVKDTFKLIPCLPPATARLHAPLCNKNPLKNGQNSLSKLPFSLSLLNSLQSGFYCYHSTCPCHSKQLLSEALTASNLLCQSSPSFGLPATLDTSKQSLPSWSLLQLACRASHCPGFPSISPVVPSQSSLLVAPLF